MLINKVRDMLKSCIPDDQKTSHWRIKYALGETGRRVEVCKKVFARAVDRGETTIDTLIAEIKKGVEESARPIGESGQPISLLGAATVKKLPSILRNQFGVRVGLDQMAKVFSFPILQKLNLLLLGWNIHLKAWEITFRVMVLVFLVPPLEKIVLRNRINFGP